MDKSGLTLNLILAVALGWSCIFLIILTGNVQNGAPFSSIHIRCTYQK